MRPQGPRARPDGNKQALLRVQPARGDLHRHHRGLLRMHVMLRNAACPGLACVTYHFVMISGLASMRGLNPPHRVKSISMTTFSQQEVEFLQNHGNEVGRRTWLCTFDLKTDGCFDVRDTQKLKEFLQDKYERKKWHFSKSKIRRDVNESPWGPGVQAVPVPHGPAQNQPPPGHPLNPTARPTRMLCQSQSQSQLSIWDRAPAVSSADNCTEVFTARPTRSQSFRDHPIKDTLLSGVERQRPGTISSGMGHQNHPSSFPALPRPSASSTFKNSFTLGRTLSTGGGAPFRAFPKSLSLDFGGLSHAHSTLSSAAPPPVTQDKYAALSQLDKVFLDNTPVTAVTTAPSDGPPQYSTLFSNRLSSSSTPASSPGVPEATSGSQTFAYFPNPFNSTASCTQPILSSSNPFKSTASDDASSSAVFPQSVSFPAPATQSAFSHQQSSNQEANGFNSFPAPESVPKVPRPMSVNPFTGNVYPSRGASLNPFI
ncbi:arf-GAP domain and FG repeat-containing protein 1-like isoform X1 [Carassius carassius]|uniref:arf-GAP domain and FG repeat-containing protein 1-like isoform X1 n=2 Tax=Carassius carassius TaxID=217509 RepID=UPI0028689F77|nr:arf-GAP domain and FG repeat-containing protein 1-like isoform X1 [Carassius carassius]